MAKNASKDKIKSDIPYLFEEYPYAAGAYFVAGVLIGVVGMWFFGG